MQIRKMTLDDAPIVYIMGQGEDGFKVSRSSKFWSLRQLQRWIEADEDVLLVAEAESRVVGFVLTTLHKPTGKVTWENQFVLPEYRGQGIAKALIVEMEKELKARDARYLHFLVKTDNSELGFYEKIGYGKGFDFTWFGKLL